MTDFFPIVIKVRIIDAPLQSPELGDKASAEAQQANDFAPDARNASIDTAQPMADAMMPNQLTMAIRHAIAELIEQLVAEPDSETPDMTTEVDSESILETKLDYPDSLHQGRSRRLH